MACIDGNHSNGDYRDYDAGLNGCDCFFTAPPPLGPPNQTCRLTSSRILEILYSSLGLTVDRSLVSFPALQEGVLALNVRLPKDGSLGGESGYRCVAQTSLSICLRTRRRAT